MFGSKERRRKRIDRRQDRIIDGQLTKKGPFKSDLIDIDRAITERKIWETKYADYKAFLELALRKVEQSNAKGDFEIKVNPVINVDRGDEKFDLPGEKLPKYTFQLGNTENPQFKILVLAGTHGGESRLARPILEGLLEVARSTDTSYRLLQKGTILFDPVVDPNGFYNQTRGAVTADGRSVNAPIVGQGWMQPGLRDPWGLGDRNSAQGRNRLESQDVLTRSNQAHYREILGGKATWIYDAHETCEYTHFPDLGFTYGGILFMVHIYINDASLAALNQLQSCIGKRGRIQKFFSDRNPLGYPRFRDQLLFHNPRMEKIERIRNRVWELGQRTQEEKFDRALGYLPMVERDFRLVESVWIGGMMFRIPKILLGPDVLGYEGVTTESFQQDLVVRAKQTVAALEAQLMVIGLGYKPSSMRRVA